MRIPVVTKIKWDAPAILLLCAVCFFVGWRNLQEWRPQDPTNLLTVSAMIASGRGASHAALTGEIASFLECNTPSAKMIGDEDIVATLPLDFYQKSHLYFSYAAGMLWRLFGIHWDVIKYFLIFMYVLSAVLLYGIGRLGMGPILSVGLSLAFAMHPTVLVYWTGIRDSSKIPFYLGALLLCGLLIAKRRPSRQILLIASLLGLMIGIGKGFRDDMLMLLPICLPVVAFCPAQSMKIRWRILALSLYIGLAVGISLPVMVFDSRNLAENGIRVLCGFSSVCESGMGITRASYARVPLVIDDYAIFMSEAAAENGSVMSTTDYENALQHNDLFAAAIKNYTMAMLKTFPADMLTRACGACIALLQFPWVPGYSLPWIGKHWGGVFFLISMLIIAGRNRTQATLLLLLIMLTCGYTSLQFLPRHTLHLYFIPFWFTGFILHCIWRVRINIRPLSKSRLTRFFRDARSVTVKVLLWTAALSIIFLLVYYPAIAYQSRQVRALADRYMKASRTPLNYALYEEGERTLLYFMPEDRQACGQIGRKYSSISSMYMMCIKTSVLPQDIWTQYESLSDSLDHFSHPLELEIKSTHPQNVCLFFSAYEYHNHFKVNRFVGVSVPTPLADHVQGIYRIDDTGLLPVSLSVPEDSEAFVSFQQIGNFWFAGAFARKWLYALSPTFSSTSTAASVLVEERRKAVAPGNPPVANPFISQRLNEAIHMADNGHLDDYMQNMRNLLQEFKYSPGTLKFIFDGIRRTTDLSLLPLWEYLKADSCDRTSIESLLPYILFHTLHRQIQLHQDIELLEPYFHRIESDLDTVARIDRRYVPEALMMFAAIGEYYLEAGNCEKASAFYCKAREYHTKDLAHYLALAKSLKCEGKDEEALSVCRHILTQAPESTQTATLVDAIYQQHEDTEGLLEEWETLVAAHPEAAIPLLHLGMAYEAVGETSKAIAAYYDAIVRTPKLHEARERMDALNHP